MLINIIIIFSSQSVLQLHNLASGELLVRLPLDMGTISGYSGKRHHSEMFYQFTSFLSPGIIYHLDLTQNPLKPKVSECVCACTCAHAGSVFSQYIAI